MDTLLHRFGKIIKGTLKGFERIVFYMEVNARDNLQARSLKVYREKYETSLAIRTSLSNLRYDDGLLNVPLHVLWNIENYIALFRSTSVILDND